MGFPGWLWNAAAAPGDVKALPANLQREYRAKSCSGAPRPMKMGTIASP
jgi:hypothetical protein